MDLSDEMKNKKETNFDKSVSSKKQQAFITRSKIYETAIELIRTKGYPNVTVDEICDQSGVTKGAFYYHFDSKESILESSYIDTDSFILKKLPIIMRKDNSLEQTKEITLLYAEMAQNKGVEIIKQTIRINLDSQKADFYDIFYGPKNRPIIEIHLAILKTGQENGEIRKDLTPEQILRHIISVFNGYVLDWCYHNASYDLKQMMQEVLPNLMFYYATR